MTREEISVMHQGLYQKRQKLMVARMNLLNRILDYDLQTGKPFSEYTQEMLWNRNILIESMNRLNEDYGITDGFLQELDAIARELSEAEDSGNNGAVRKCLRDAESVLIRQKEGEVNETV